MAEQLRTPQEIADKTIREVGGIGVHATDPVPLEQAWTEAHLIDAIVDLTLKTQALESGASVETEEQKEPLKNEARQRVLSGIDGHLLGIDRQSAITGLRLTTTEPNPSGEGQREVRLKVSRDSNGGRFVEVIYPDRRQKYEGEISDRVRREALSGQYVDDRLVVLGERLKLQQPDTDGKSDWEIYAVSVVGLDGSAEDRRNSLKANGIKTFDAPLPLTAEYLDRISSLLQNAQPPDNN